MLIYYITADERRYMREEKDLKFNLLVKYLEIVSRYHELVPLLQLIW